MTTQHEHLGLAKPLQNAIVMKRSYRRHRHNNFTIRISFFFFFLRRQREGNKKAKKWKRIAFTKLNPDEIREMKESIKSIGEENADLMCVQMIDPCDEQNKDWVPYDYCTHCITNKNERNPT